jgi:hypothetical protein
MNNQLPTAQLLAFMERQLVLPLLPYFNRLEGRPRTAHFDRALKAEVRDALWMLTRQWQMGEFKGDDAGSPVSSKVWMDRTLLTKYRPAGSVAEPFDNSQPLEAVVERRRVPFELGDVEIALDLRLLMGRHWSKLLRKHGFDAALIAEYRRQFAVHRPDPERREDHYYTSDLQSWRKYEAMADRHIDGRKLYDDIVTDDSRHVITVGADAALHTDLIELGNRFRRWFDRLISQPRDGANDAWQPSRLEYSFQCSAPDGTAEKVFSADEYYHGHLDWYNFSIDPAERTLGNVVETELPEGHDEPIVRSFIPAPLQFDGMPNTRWWSFEEGGTNFGDIKPDTTDINKLLLMEFGLVYANDWFLVPFTMPAGSVATVRGMSVRNVFGENVWITASGAGIDDNPERWTMYSMDIAGDDRRLADLSLMVVPSVPKIQEGRPIEEVHLVRDEVANMVWGIETRVALPCGESTAGYEAALNTVAHLKRLIERSGAPAAHGDPEPAAPLRYKVMSSVPENWIPFIPTHVEGDNREIQLQRGSMPRIIAGDPEEEIEKVKPRTSLLRDGLDTPAKAAYYLHEEEVLKAGTCVSQSYQRTRWYDGRVYTWLGASKRTGRGEAASQLRFDYLQAVEKPAAED